MGDPSEDDVPTPLRMSCRRRKYFIVKLLTIISMAMVQWILLGMCQESLIILFDMSNHCSIVVSSTAKVLVFLMMRDRLCWLSASRSGGSFAVTVVVF